MCLSCTLVSYKFVYKLNFHTVPWECYKTLEILLKQLPIFSNLICDLIC